MNYKSKAVCRECRDKTVSRPRGLCWQCYHKPGMKEKYPATSKYAKKDDEPTEEELDALVEKYLPTMPPASTRKPGRTHSRVSKYDTLL